MSRLRTGAVCILLGIISGSAVAVSVATPADDASEPKSGPEYAFAWPVSVTGTDSLHQLTLPADVYPVLSRMDLSDLELIDAEGQPVPVSVLPQASLNAWLDMPTPMQIARQQGMALAEGETYPSERAQIRLLVQSNQTEVLPIRALRISYEHRRELPADATFRVRAAGDGVELASDGEWLHLNEVASRFNADTRTGEVRLNLEPTATRELELMIAPVPASLTVRSVMAEYAVEEGLDLRWVDTDLLPQEAPATQRNAFEFKAPGPAPYHRARFTLDTDHVGEIALLSLDSAGYWQGQGQITSYDIALDDARFARNTLGFRETRARRWRVIVSPAPVTPPKLQLAYRPDVIVFSKRGPASLTLLAGSQRARRPVYPVIDMVEDVRAQMGRDWQPPVASIGKRVSWHGVDALKPATAADPREYRAWLLWSLLVAAAVFVGYMAVSMIRETPRDEAPKP